MPGDCAYDIFEWLSWNGITPLPCRPLSKVPIDQISTFKVYGEDRSDDSFHIASPERMRVIKNWWDQKAYHLQAGPGDESISVDCSPGYNSLRRIFGVDVDTDDLYSAAMENPILKECPAVRGKKGVKLIGFVTGNPPVILQYYKPGNDHPLLEFFSDGKHMLVFGEHPDSTPDHRIYYRVIRGFGSRIPTVGWDSIKEAVEEIAARESLSLVRCDAQVSEQKPQYSGTVTNRAEIRIEEICKPLNPVVNGKNMYGVNPFHGSTTGKNLHINLETQQWYCHRCRVGGGVNSWLQIIYAFSEGYRSPTICRDVMQKVGRL